MPGAGSRSALLLDVVVKLGTIALLALALTAPNLPQFAGKAFLGRAIAYPFALAILPAIWVLFWRRRYPFPVLSDILLGLPFLIDMAGNSLNLHDTVWWWGDANHLVTWALHTAAIAFLLRMFGLPRWIRAGLGIGWAATTAILWELGQYVAVVATAPETAPTSTETLGRLGLALLGGALTALAVAWWRPHGEAPRSGAGWSR
ncbi:MAG TPA: hypothetical protein VJ850_10165 [Candidatus Limnocylindrales bacterium]|nr:hypothetical protein [Candidatus Limnocylindrales bacterium]